MAHLLPPAGVRSYKDEAFMFCSVQACDFFGRELQSRIPPNIHDYRWTDYKENERVCQEQSAAIEAIKARSMQSRYRSKFNPTLKCPSTLQDQWRIPPCACPQHRGVGHRGGKDCGCVLADRADIVSGTRRYAPPGGAFKEHGRASVSTNRFSDGAQRGGNVYGDSYSSGVAGSGDGLWVQGRSYQSLPYRGIIDGGPSSSQQPGAAPAEGAMARDWGYCPPIGLDPQCLVRPRDKSISSSVRPIGDPYIAQESKPSCPSVHHVPVFRKGDFTFDDWLRTVNQREPPAALRDACIPSLVSWCKPVSLECPPSGYSLLPLQSALCY